MKKLNLNRRTFMQGAGTIALATGALGYRPRAARAGGVNLKLGHQLGQTHPTYQAVEQMAAAIAERTDGEVKISVFPNAALGSPPDMVKQAQMGALDLVMFNPPNIESQDATASVIQIPYQFDDYAHVHRVLGGTAQGWLNTFFERNKLHWIANFEYGFRALSNSRRPVNTPEDIAGLKLRVPPELSIKATFDALGANTQTIAFDELYLALSSGVVDGQDNPVSVDYANKFYEVQKHIATTRHIYTSFMLVGNPRIWKGLSPDVQAVISEEALKAGKWAQEAVVANEEQMLVAMEEDGVTITRPDPAPFRAKMGPAWDAMRERIGDKTWEEWMGYVDAARQKV
ncbi:TRAP transporter substrate-binding protein [Pseudooceanicola sp. CBS1P-1]|uniref:DctP family TRAP transporter solute-binding subunit n=1 Tax=Pseudooceanicola albus TaxID=2692189 RepID=A0A6L7G4Q2_9RHOB|nr:MULTISPECIES: TRAP transporter substrate-binding protein [Pseudooceanicola]MBT9386833.1 TRAP transporter substrate-binding protein [Pseudooceanicola endophyticus]MXN19344.1 DctP family TRAP transporter solute-binding subunit [Pseudooceanicola albus]